MRELIRKCHERGLDLSIYVRKWLKDRPKEEATGIYKGN